MKHWLARFLVISGFVVVCFVGGILLVNLVMSYMVGRGDEAEAPDLHGMDIAEARRLLQEQNLSLTIADQRYNDNLPPDAVIEQDPRAGRRMKRVRPIEVTTSLGPELATVPDLRGVPLSDAVERLKTAGLTPGDVDRAHVDGLAADAVVLSRPHAGESVKKGSTVTLLVSDGPPPIDWVMPDLRGRTEARAREALESLGLTATVERGQGTGGHPGIVMSQTPPPGDRVVEGDEVELVVAP